MEIHNCEICSYTTTNVYNFRRHCKSIRHLNKVKVVHNVNVGVHNVNSNSKDSNKSMCEFCAKEFNSRSSKSRHIKYFCKVKKEKDNDKKEIEELKKQLAILQKQSHANNNHFDIGNIQNNIIGQQNVFILNHKDTDYDFLTDKDYLKCIADNNHCVKKLIETVHFNPKKPENMNIYISSHKGKHILVYRDDTWQIHDKNKEIDNLYEMNEISLENWYDENKEKFPDKVKSFERYLKNKDDDDTLIRSIKDEIIRMLYNKRILVQET